MLCRISTAASALFLGTESDQLFIDRLNASIIIDWSSLMSGAALSADRFLDDTLDLVASIG